MSDARRFMANDVVHAVAAPEIMYTVQSVFNRRDGSVRLACEDGKGEIHIMAQEGLQRVFPQVDHNAVVADAAALLRHARTALFGSVSVDTVASALTTVNTVIGMLERLEKIDG